MYEQKKKNSRDRIEEELGRARAAIRKALRTQNYTSDREEIYIPRGCIYKNPIAFHQLSFDNTSFSSFFFWVGVEKLHSIFNFTSMLAYIFRVQVTDVTFINFT